MSNTILLDNLYPKISTSIKPNISKYKQAVGKSIERRSKDLYDICPCDRLYFTFDDIENFYKALNITANSIKEILSKTYYYDIEKFNPRSAKDEFTVAMIMVIRYFYKQKMQKELELSAVYLSFSSKFYPSIHHGLFPKVQPSEHRYVMEYVVNSKLSNKYDLKKYGNIFNSIKSISNTWITSYKDRLNRCEDEDVVYVIQQLHSRIKSFMKNIAEVYYDVYSNKEEYMVYDSDNLNDTGYRLVDNDSLKIERALEKTMEMLNTSSVDYRNCKMCADSNIKTDEIKSIIETILNDSNNVPLIKDLCRCIITEYFINSKNKDIRDIDFLTTTMSVKPNTKNPNILKEKQLIEYLLSENSPSYLRRKSREATKNSYHRAILIYFTLSIHSANK